MASICTLAPAAGVQVGSLGAGETLAPKLSRQEVGQAPTAAGLQKMVQGPWAGGGGGSVPAFLYCPLSRGGARGARDRPQLGPEGVCPASPGGG